MVGEDSRQYRDWVRAGLSGDRTPVVVRFSKPVQTGLEAHTMDIGAFLGVKQLWHGIDHPPTTCAEVKERVEQYLYSPFGPSWPVLH
jgi:hypothetical protein